MREPLPLELLGEFVVDLTMSVFVGARKKPHSATAVVGPAGIIENWIDTNSLNRDSASPRSGGFRADIVQPSRARGALSSSFRDHDWTSIPVKDFAQHLAQRTIGVVSERDRSAAGGPLVVGIEVDADQIQETGVSAELRTGLARDHVDRLELRQPTPFRLDHGRTANRGRRDVNQGLGGYYRRLTIGLDRARGCNRGSYELPLEFRSAALAARLELQMVDRPCPVRNFVDRADKRHGL